MPQMDALSWGSLLPAICASSAGSLMGVKYGYESHP